MPNVDFQRHSFLGGEVSPSLYERADMDKFGKWFSRAENIRFRETGAFRNRSGFVKVADTRYNQRGQIIKLLSFSFNDEESFLVELGPGYARFFRNGSPIMNGSVPYEITTTFNSFTEKDLKYAQAGDTVFITHPQYGIYELARLQADGSEWEWRKFKADILPMKEENDDKNKTVSVSDANFDSQWASVYNPTSQNYSNFKLTFDGSVVLEREAVAKDQIASLVSEAVGNTYNCYITSDDKLYISATNTTDTVPTFSIAFDSIYSKEVPESRSGYIQVAGTSTVSVDYSDFQKINSVYCSVYCGRSGDWVFLGSKNCAADTIQESISQVINFGACRYSNFVLVTSDGISNDSANNILSYEVRAYAGSSMGAYSNTSTIFNITGIKEVTDSYTNNSSQETLTDAGKYVAIANFNMFENMEVGDVFLVKHAVDAQTLGDRAFSVGSYTLGPIKSDGNWRAWSTGNWTGVIKLQYSEDNGVTWIDYQTWASSGDANTTPTNVNTSGTLTTDNIILFRVQITVASTGTASLVFHFVANSFSINSYYKILTKSSNTTVFVECIKNDVGTFSSKYEWRKPAFSNAEGWPQTVAFYQNRLFFGKDYIVYGSRSNDFWDFYEPVKLQADDPVTMSLLSQKVNEIRNLTTQRSFFTFTAGGEFGIGSEGALTQNDKYLKPFSANGSAHCNPVLISDVVLFVDKSFNSIRALKYSLESDGYEAPDITLTLRSLIESEKIISTDIIYEEKEALFLSDTGTIWVLKYITDQNVLSWSHFRHAFGKITNICVVPNGPKHDLYVGVESVNGKWIERLSSEEYMDTVEYFSATNDSTVAVTGVAGDKKLVLQGNKRYIETISSEGTIPTPDDHTQGFKVGSAYTSIATLLSPIVQSSDYSHTNYELKNPYKVFFYYLNSHGFKVGVEESEKMAIEWQPINADIDSELDLTSGKKSVLIPSRFDGSSRVSFMQEEPFPMEVADVLIQADFGGK